MQPRRNELPSGAELGAATAFRLRRYSLRTIVVYLGAIGALACAGQGQSVPNQQISDPMLKVVPDANARAIQQEQVEKQRVFEAGGSERRKQIAVDTARMLKLATDLKTEVDKTTKDTLSMTVIRKAEEIEKLAHDVKERMRPNAGTN